LRIGKLSIGLPLHIDGLPSEFDLIGLAGVTLDLRQRLVACDCLYLFGSTASLS
jgi:hypothetical protein